MITEHESTEATRRGVRFEPPLRRPQVKSDKARQPRERREATTATAEAGAPKILRYGAGF
jgi:hypothetical protein